MSYCVARDARWERLNLQTAFQPWEDRNLLQRIGVGSLNSNGVAFVSEIGEFKCDVDIVFATEPWNVFLPDPHQVSKMRCFRECNTFAGT